MGEEIFLTDETVLTAETGVPTAFTIIEQIARGGFVECYRVEKNGVRGTLRKVQAEHHGYLESYALVKEASRNNNELQGFLPNFEIYHDAQNKKYIFCVDPYLITFEAICQRARQADGNGAFHLLQILSALKYLTECVLALHRAGLVHRDLTPSNFGFKILNGEVLTQAISLFDVNTICKVGKAQNFVGTEGFSEPITPVNNLSDIYSLGALLFYALVDKKYSPRNYEDIEKLTSSSTLLAESENLHPNMRYLLTRILRNCLCSRFFRYQKCEALLEDLNKANYYATPGELATSHADNWSKVNSYFEKRKGKNYLLPIQYHLSAHPLYEKKLRTEKQLRVLVLGFGSFGQKFVDTSLALGQLPNTELNVKIVSDNDLDFKLYVEKRPALKQFFSVDMEVEQSYGKVEFDDINRDATQITSLKGYSPHYIFIALGDDNKNLQVAEKCSEIAAAENIPCLVNFVWSQENLPQSTAIPVTVNLDEKSELHAEIERMAFNVHLLWEKNLQIDFEKTRRSFLTAYNHDSSVLSALHIRYKLYYAGLDLQSTPVELATAFENLSKSVEGKAILEELIAAEHRRWVAEKVVGGWTCRKVTECGTGETKDKRAKTHVCIVRSLPNQNLRRNFTQAQWNNLSPKELDGLDELDRMSVELHNFFVRQAAQIKQQNLLNDDNIVALRDLLSADSNCIATFNEWYACLCELWDNNPRRVYLYEGLRQKVLDAIKILPAKTRELSKQKLDALHKSFRLVFESQRYYRFKDEDVKLVEEIPFILTFDSEKFTFVVPYQVGGGFRNLAACALVNPKRLLYLVSLKNKSDYLAFRDSVKKEFKGLANFCKQRKLRKNVEWVIGYDEDVVNASLSEALEENLRDFECVDTVSWLETFEFEGYLLERQKGAESIFVEKNQSGFVYDELPTYKFDALTREFDIAPLKWIPHSATNNFLTVAEVLALGDAVILQQDNPEFVDLVPKMAALYDGDKQTWLELGKIAQVTPIVTLKRKSTGTPLKLNYIIPSECRIAVEKIFAVLKEEQLIGGESRVVALSPTACSVFVDVLSANKNTHTDFDKLFGEPYRLMRPAEIVVDVADSEIQIGCNSLQVKNFRITNQRVIELLKKLSDLHCITGLTIHGDKVRFSYATLKMKKLLTDSRAILLTTFYHNVTSLGRYNDVACDLTCKRGEKIYHLDCVLTRGFESTLVTFSANVAEELGGLFSDTIIATENNFFEQVKSLDEK